LNRCDLCDEGGLDRFPSAKANANQKNVSWQPNINNANPANNKGLLPTCLLEEEHEEHLGTHGNFTDVPRSE
jgi:hypothetical protein